MWLGDLCMRSGMQGFSRSLPHKQLAGEPKRLHSRALPDPGKESFAPGSHSDAASTFSSSVR